MFKVNGYEKNLGVIAQKDFNPITTPVFIESRMMMDPDTAKWADFGITFGAEEGGSVCSIFAAEDTQEIRCWSLILGIDQGSYKVEITPGTWHILRIEVYPETMQFSYIVDGKEIGTYVPQNSVSVRSLEYVHIARLNNWGTSAQNPVGYIDYVRMGAIEDDPTLYDGFNMSTYNGRFDSTKWTYDQHDKDGSAIQKDGVLVFTQSGIEKGQTLRANEYWPFKLTESVAFEANLKSDMTSDGFVVMALEGNVIDHVSCGLHAMSDAVAAHCWTPSGDPHIIVTHGTWHVVRIEINLTTNTVTSYIDGKKLSEDRYTRSLKNSTLYLNINVWAGPNRVESTRPMIGYVDNVRVYPLEYVNP